jgi:hypothetical protein
MQCRCWQGSDGERGVTTRPTDATKLPLHPWQRTHAKVTSWFDQATAAAAAAFPETGAPNGYGNNHNHARRPPLSRLSTDVARPRHNHHIEVPPEHVASLTSLVQPSAASGTGESGPSKGSRDGQEGMVGAEVGGSSAGSTARAERLARQAKRAERRAARVAKKKKRALDRAEALGGPAGAALLREHLLTGEL